MDFLPLILQLIVLGVAVGVVSNALGVGGGLIMVPAFIEFVPGMDPHTAKGTSLFIIIFVAAANAWQLNRGHEHVEHGLAARLAIGSIAGGFTGAWATQYLSPAAVTWVFVAVVGALALRTFLQGQEPRPSAMAPAVRRAMILATGLGAGVISGMTGVGGGAIMVPLLLVAGLAPNQRVVAISNMVMVVTCVAASAAHLIAPKTTDLAYTAGQINFLLPPLILLGAFAGGPAGRWINRRLTYQRRRIVMGGFLLLVAARLAYRALTGLP